jgi:hypothetical protein
MSSRTDGCGSNDRTAPAAEKGEGGKFRVPRSLLSEHGVERDETLARAGGERDLGFLARRNQSRKRLARADFGELRLNVHM